MNLENYGLKYKLFGRRLATILSTSLLLTATADTLFGQRQIPERDQKVFANRGDIKLLPAPLKNRLIEMVGLPHTYLPAIAFDEADEPNQLVSYYLLDTQGFQPNVFTAKIPGINDGAMQTAANAANGGRPTIGAVRVVVEPKVGLPTDPNDPGVAVDMFTDVSGLFVINNESGWYEGWIIREIRVPPVSAARRPNGRALYGTMTPEDAAANAAKGAGNNAVAGNFVTMNGNAARLPAITDVAPDNVGNTVPFPVSLGTFNASQQSDVHAYWEFNPNTNWVFPHFELPFTGGVPGTFANGMVGNLSSALNGSPFVVPGSGPAGIINNAVTYGDNPEDPRDPDRGLALTPEEKAAQNPAQFERRLRFIPSGMTEELLLDVFERVASFEPNVTNVGQRIFDAYAYEVSLVDQNGDGVISFDEANIDGTSDGGQPNRRLFLPLTAFNRYAMTRELNDGMLAPRFAPGQRGYVLDGDLVLVNPAVAASVPRDADNR